MNTEANKQIRLRVKNANPIGTTATISSGTVASDYIDGGFRYTPSISTNTVLFTALFRV